MHAARIRFLKQRIKIMRAKGSRGKPTSWWHKLRSLMTALEMLTEPKGKAS